MPTSKKNKTYYMDDIAESCLETTDKLADKFELSDELWDELYDMLSDWLQEKLNHPDYRSHN